MACEDLQQTTDINTGCESVKMDMEFVAYHIPWDKITSKTFNKDTGKCSALATTVANKLTARGQMPFNGTNTAGDVKNFGMTFTQNFQFVVYGNTPTSAKVVNSLAHGKHVFILVQEGHTWESKYIVLGIESGMHISASDLTPYGDNGGWLVTMQAMNNESSAMFINTGTESTTEAIITAIKAL